MRRSAQKSLEKLRRNIQKSLEKVRRNHEKSLEKCIFYDYGREGQLLTLPSYMQFLLDLEPEEFIIEPIDADAVNSLARDILNQ